ncbi:methyltransferase domain-containing protein [Iocasia frigidifontis]|uniref:protein-glutamate O-methyltransferase n=1 Tax=Iocasia fonsfrigidae TaxID=2682810 RepID=A0A8A7KL14_9FIRM|nr:CheR family methyltransferase [Iocasia fonsfrigidae]QTL99527.1 methyltransferase domain-containing protein [Iocasia fonsfrigidae]
MISDQLFYKFSNILNKEIGLSLPLKKKYLLYTRLTGRLRELGLNDFDTYYNLIIGNRSELVKLYNLLTTNVTRFFREKYHFKYLQEEVLPLFLTAEKKKIRAWSAGCSTGEEAYSLAIVLEQFFQGKGYDIKIIATDINTEVLEFARKGVYSYQKVADIPYELLTRYFMLGQEQNRGFFKVKNHLRKMLTFENLNLNLEDYAINYKFDFIFCRNVFIYFDQKTRKRILNNFYNYLQDDGYLFLGHADSTRLNSNKWLQVWKTTFQKNI